jgi:hypothetical protein
VLLSTPQTGSHNAMHIIGLVVEVVVVLELSGIWGKEGIPGFSSGGKIIPVSWGVHSPSCFT